MDAEDAGDRSALGWPVAVANVMSRIHLTLSLRPEEKLHQIAAPAECDTAGGPAYSVDFRRTLGDLDVFALWDGNEGNPAGIYQARLTAVVSPPRDLVATRGDDWVLQVDLSTRREVTASGALDLALTFTRLRGALFRDGSEFRPPRENPDLVVYQHRDGSPRGFAWRCTVVGDTDHESTVTDDVFVEAVTGEHLGTTRISIS
ncbi:hypothetical protein AB0F15_25235 [Amycolatopsis sp. NPDC026612]|uniref:hypothetical protein n=1 Tax=Amycolatopsis sp. NPDC026612 TaxID=3155466 RepID=UPI0033C2E5A2